MNDSLHKQIRKKRHQYEDLRLQGLGIIAGGIFNYFFH